MKLKWKVLVEISIEEMEIENVCGRLVSVICIIHYTNYYT